MKLIMKVKRIENLHVIRNVEDWKQKIKPKTNKNQSTELHPKITTGSISFTVITRYYKWWATTPQKTTNITY